MNRFAFARGLVKQRLLTSRTHVYDGFRPAVEALEGRWLPSATISHGDLVINGTGLRDSVVVDQIRQNGEVILKVTHQVGFLPAGPPEIFKLAQVNDSIVFYGGDGNDSFFYSNLTTARNLSVFAHGGRGNDDLHGGKGDDFLYGEDGDDVLTGNYGNDWLEGGAGSDRMWGAAGSDRLYGYLANVHQVPSGADGADVLYGGSGDDHLDGGIDGKWDKLVGGTGKDGFVVENATLRGIDHGKPVTKVINIDRPTDYHPQEGDWWDTI